MINLFNYSRSILFIYVFLHSSITLFVHRCVLQVKFPSLKYASFTQRKQHLSQKTANRCKHHALPLLQCTNACKQPPHPERHKKPPLENERLFEKIADSKESIFPVRCFFVGSECVWRVFLGGFTPSSFLSIALISPYLHVFCSLETNSKGRK